MDALDDDFKRQHAVQLLTDITIDSSSEDEVKKSLESLKHCGDELDVGGQPIFRYCNAHQAASVMR